MRGGGECDCVGPRHSDAGRQGTSSVEGAGDSRRREGLRRTQLHTVSAATGSCVCVCVRVFVCVRGSSQVMEGGETREREREIHDLLDAVRAVDIRQEDREQRANLSLQENIISCSSV